MYPHQENNNYRTGLTVACVSLFFWFCRELKEYHGKTSARALAREQQNQAFAQAKIDAKEIQQLEAELGKLCENPLTRLTAIGKNKDMLVLHAKGIIDESKKHLKNILGYEKAMLGALKAIVAAIKENKTDLHKLYVLGGVLYSDRNRNAVVEFYPVEKGREYDYRTEANELFVCSDYDDVPRKNIA